MQDSSVQSTTRPWYFAWVILFMVPFTGMGIDLYAPSLPWIMKAFGTTASLAKLTIPMFLIGYAIGPIFFGTLSDTYGRKRMLYWGLLLYVISCLVVIFLPNIWVMLGMRIFQGAAAGSIGAAYRAMSSDSYQPGPELHKMGASIAIAWTTGPVIAPFIGGYLQHFFGWQANFIFFVVYAVLVLLFMLKMPETLKNPVPLHVSRTIKNYGTMLKSPVYWGGVVCMGVTYSFITIFNVIGPFLIQNVLHYNVLVFGRIALLMGLGFFIGTFVNRVLLKYFKLYQLVPVRLIVSILLSIVSLLVGLLYPVNLWLYVAPTFCIFLFISGVFPAGMSTCMGLFPHMGGTSAALMAFMFSSFSAVMTIVASYLESSTQVPASLAYIVLGACCLLCYTLLMHRSFKSEQ